jgi:hypothetical protein
MYLHVWSGVLIAGRTVHFFNVKCNGRGEFIAYLFLWSSPSKIYTCKEDSIFLISDTRDSVNDLDITNVHKWSRDQLELNASKKAIY